MNQRLENIIEYSQLSKSDFAKKISATKQEVSNWCGGTRISIRRIRDILSTFPLVDGHWFLTGEGEMIREKACSREKSKEITEVDYDIPYYKKKIEELSEKLIECQGQNIQLLLGKKKD